MRRRWPTQHPPTTLDVSYQNRLVTSIKRAAAFFVVTTPMGAVYGYLSLEGLSGLAPVALLEVVALALEARRLPSARWAARAAGLGFCSGFALVWLVLLGGKGYCCGPAIDTLYAVALVAIALSPALIVWVRTASRRQPR